MAQAVSNGEGTFMRYHPLPILYDCIGNGLELAWRQDDVTLLD
ncbi:hypothetical protein [Plantactinospora mayteni]|nr:hypothetical protein [Plantactinospora mayteni]